MRSLAFLLLVVAELGSDSNLFRARIPLILWGHWPMPNSPASNREEFLKEAIALAPTGVVSLLIDAP
jgi:hypothetical protein